MCHKNHAIDVTKGFYLSQEGIGVVMIVIIMSMRSWVQIKAGEIRLLIKYKTW